MTDRDARWFVNDARGRGRSRLLRDLWGSRDVVRVFAQRDLQLRYRQAALGVVWVLLQPIATVALLTVVFSRITGSTTDAPYPVFALCGMLLWIYFSSAVTRGSEVLVENPTLITKVWFPRIAAPVASLLSPLADLAIGVVLLLALQLALGGALRWTLLLLPVIVAWAALLALGVVLFLAAFNVRYRDVRHAIGPVLQILFFATPVAYSLALIPAWGRVLVGLNPLTGLIELMRWAVLGGAWPGVTLFATLAWTVVLLIAGGAYFRVAERTFADVI